MTQEPINNARSRMDKALDSLTHDLAGIRTGRAGPGLVENIKADYYGTPTPLKQIATISTPEAKVIVIQPWDREALKPIEKAIAQSDLGLTPSNDGALIRLVVPPLTEDRRKELVKMVHKRVEEGRIAIRNIRRDSHDQLRAQEKDHQISEDDLRRAEQELQKITDNFVKKTDQAGQEKETDLLTV